MSGPELLTAEELAKYLRVRPNTIRAWSRCGRIPRVYLSPKVVRFDPMTVIAALQRRHHKEVSHD